MGRLCSRDSQLVPFSFFSDASYAAVRLLRLKGRYVRPLPNSRLRSSCPLRLYNHVLVPAMSRICPGDDAVGRRRRFSSPDLSCPLGANPSHRHKPSRRRRPAKTVPSESRHLRPIPSHRFQHHGFCGKGGRVFSVRRWVEVFGRMPRTATPTRRSTDVVMTSVTVPGRQLEPQRTRPAPRYTRLHGIEN